MRDVVAWLFMSLDGVVEAPENWVLPDEDMFRMIENDYATADALLLGRRTYDVFAASWPQRGSDIPNADWMNNVAKFVVSTTLSSPEWNNTTVLTEDLETTVTELKGRHGKNIMVNGSATLVASLLSAGLLDRLTLYIHPVLLGSGARLFAEGQAQVPLELVESKPLTTGVNAVVYRPTAS
jgi:dihydrofolate reductase